MRRRDLMLWLAVGASPFAAARAQTPPTIPPETIMVTATYLPGSEIPLGDVPNDISVLTQQQIARTPIPSLTQALLENLPDVTVNDVEGNTFQPDLLFRGFTASPVAGTSEGIAVFLNGARFNDPFGDTVNWDLIPSQAIESATIEASNPLYGLNALGGSVNVRLKTGFDLQGGSVTAYGGSYDRGAGLAEYGQQIGNSAIYGAGELLYDGGYRQTQASNVRRFYGDYAWHDGDSAIDLGVDAADNTLGNPGASPVQELDVDPSGIFTGPNIVKNQYVGVFLNAQHSFSDALSFQGEAYFQSLTQRVSNGATADSDPCDDGSGALCNDDGTEVTTYGGAVVPDFLNGGTYSNLVLEGLETKGYGASGQLTDTAPIAGFANHAVLGGSFDGSDSNFNADTAIGGFTSNGSQLYVAPPQYIQVQPSEGITPVHVATTTRDYGVFLADTFTITQRLTATADLRFNNDETNLYDKLGNTLNGQHRFDSLNPELGMTYQVVPVAQIYASFAQANRAPTPTELSCASAANPCSLLNFFIGDPNLKQVISQTWETGLRGKATAVGGQVSWSADYFHTADRDDLIFESALDNPNLAYYTNAGRTLRQGVEADVHYTTGQLHLTLDYAFTDATYQSSLLINSASNPNTDANGNEHVTPGDHIPGIPAQRGTIVAEYDLTDRWRIGGSAIFSGAQWRFGDEANLAKQVGGYVVLDLDTLYRLTDAISLFGVIDNVTNRRYDTYGTFGPTTAVPFPMVPGGVSDPRTASPGQPISVYAGGRLSF